MAGERVLVVDDSLVYRDLLVNHILTPNDYEPLTANDGEEGLRVTQQEVPDLIIMDMQMPGMTGIQVLEALHEEGSDIPVILMTLHGSEDLVVRAFRLGVKDYVIKPFDIEEMLTAMDKALTEVRLRRERDALTRTLEAERRQLEAVLTSAEEGILLVEDSEEEGPLAPEDLPVRVQNLLMWCVGVAFGRWDVRMALDPSLLPALQGPFERLPRCAPGALVGPDGLPAATEAIARPPALSNRVNRNV